MAADEVMMLSPSEYEGENGTAVVGRVVLVRKTRITHNERGQKGKGKAAKGAKGKADSEKCEVHILGGNTMSEVLFCEAWGDAATTFANHAQMGRLIKISGAKYIAQRPQYSTSRLVYYLRIVGQVGHVGVGTRVEELQNPTSRWVGIPSHHPFVEVTAIQSVEETLQICLLAIVVDQPGAVMRTTHYGEAQVCNAIVRQGTTTIRCSFWRNQATLLSRFGVGDVVAIYQVRVVKMGRGEWELRATESTTIDNCPADLVASVQANTDLQQAPTQSLTRPAAMAVDYDIVKTTPACVASLTSLLMPGKPRDLSGVHEVHSVTALGLSSVLQDESYFMRCCSKCWKQVAESDIACLEHQDETVVDRWIGKVMLADDSGSGEAMIYHDAISATKVLPDACSALTASQITSLSRKLRSTPWSMRIIYRRNDARLQNYLEIKKMTPTLSKDGIVRTWRLTPVPEAPAGPTYPYATCGSVKHDAALGITSVKGREVTAVRLWVRFLDVGEEEETAVPDTQIGLRVKRRVRCAADPQDEQVYTLTQAGLSSGVQWLVQAADQSTYIVLASKRGDGPLYTTIGSLNVTAFDARTLQQYILQTITRKRGDVLCMQSTDTPLKRKSMIESGMPVVELSESERFVERKFLSA